MFTKAMRRVAITLAALMIAGTAAAGEWRVARATGQVAIGSGRAQPVALGPSSNVPDGATISTGQGGRVMLVRGRESMTIGPNSVVVVPASRSGRTTILQQAGDVLFDVDRRSVQHFAVETPNLAAVVKGTAFQVSVRPSQSVVIVNRGIVDVTALAAGQSVELQAGQRAGVRGNGGLTVSAGVNKATILQVPARQPEVVPAQSQANGYAFAGDGNAGKAPAHSNAGGNGNSNAGGNGNSNAGGNGNGNAGGNGNGNAGGNGNGNAGGNGNGNAGGNGNGNAGGNGNGNGSGN